MARDRHRRCIYSGGSIVNAVINDYNHNNNNLFKSHASVMPSLYRLMSDYTMIYIIIHKRKDNRRLMILKKIVN